MAEVISTVGISGAGKTTWAKNFVNTHESWVLIDTDEIRKELWGDPTDQQHGEVVFQTAYERTREALSKGQNVMFCATSIRVYMRRQLKRILPRGTKLTFAWIHTDLNTALARNAGRQKFVPEEVIHDQYARFQPFEADESYFEIRN